MNGYRPSETTSAAGATSPAAKFSGARQRVLKHVRGQLLPARPGDGTAARPQLLKKVRRLRKLANLMDAAIELPIVKRRIGLDSLIGLVPGIGDLATVGVSAYIVREAWMMGVPKTKLAKMVGNLGIDFVTGTVPVVGDLFDIAFKANLKNLKILEDHFEIKSEDEAV